MILTLADEGTITVEDPAEAARTVRAALESSADLQPVIVSIDGVWDMHIDIGLATDRGTIQVYASSSEPPYWVTFNPRPLGPLEAAKVTFLLHGRHHTELPAEYLIPSEKVWPALDSLLVEGTRSRDVEWREV